jgi:RNA recognition motif-containing protein
VPSEESTLFVANIPSEIEEEELEEIFGKYGILHEVHSFEVDNPTIPTPPSKCAFVRYYSVVSAKKALKATHGQILNKKKLKVIFAKKRKLEDSATRDYDLPFHKCIELVNYYLGFHTWSSSIVSMEKIQYEQRKEDRLFSCTYRCTVRLTLREDNRSVEGIGEGTAIDSDKGEVVDKAKKTALTNARRNAFARTVLIVLDNGKVAVHFLGTPVPSEMLPEPEPSAAEEEPDAMTDEPIYIPRAVVKEDYVCY